MSRVYTRFIKGFLPVHAQSELTDLRIYVKEKYEYIRVKKSITKLLGPQYKLGHDRIELDITYDCNLGCHDCARSCRQSPTSEHITVEQIQKLIKESIENNIKWKCIRILGGEPTIHPNFSEIIYLLLEYKKTFSHDSLVQLVTNGFGKKVNDILSNVPKEIEICNTAKMSVTQPQFIPFNVAPVDLQQYECADYSNGCSVLINCGLGFTPYGYYACAVAGGIDRVFGFNVGRKKMPSLDDSMIDHLYLFCRLCGFFLNKRQSNHKVMLSPTWKKAYKEWETKQPVLTRY